MALSAAHHSAARKPILITGGSGFIGSHVREQLATLKIPVINLDLEIPKSTARTETTIIGDIRKPDDLDSVMAQHRELGAVIHLAAIVSVPECEGDPVGSAKTNIEGTHNVIACLKAQRIAPPLVFASSAAVYGHRGQAGKSLSEEDTLDPLSHYARHKIAGELALAQSGLRTTALRLFNVYGVGQDPRSPYSGVITRFAEQLKVGEPLRLNGGGVQTRDFVSVIDVARALVMAATGAGPRTPQIFNIGSGTSVTIRQLAELMRTLQQASGAAGTQNSPGSPIEDAPPRNGDVQHSLANITRARTTLKWSPAIGFKDGLAQLLR